jgi:hypothetical protein
LSGRSPATGYQFVFADVAEEDDEGEWEKPDAAALVPAAAVARRPRIRTSHSCNASQGIPPARTTTRTAVKPRNCCTRSAPQKRCGGSPLALTILPAVRCCAIRGGTSQRRDRCRFSASPRRLRPRSSSSS